MVTRIGDAAHAAQINGFLQSTQSRMRETQVSIATGKNAQTFSEIPDQAAFLVTTREELAVEEAFAQQNGGNLDRLRSMESSVGNITDVVERMRVLLTQRLGGPTGDSVPIDTEADSAMAEIAARLNVRLDGRYLFSGTSSDQIAITLPATINSAADLTNIYGGDTISPVLRVDRDIEIDIGVTAADFTAVLDELADIKAAHLADNDAALQAGFDALDGLLEGFADIRGELGSKSARIETIQEGQRFNANFLLETVSRIEDTDLPAAISRLAQDEVTVEASYLTVSRINQLSLADYLR